ncbi:YncE family protein [Ectobacillus ponti]|uniref:YncE family protein n=1 Tax=Ectobacillus ponti TaxID=2961894 RepID=A0AA41X4B3_9BACI|nr:YncE family protein [Ectobacillus ponti]MCP8968482.1 YncE family protein [Ectobacillus ponti]
MRKVILLLLLVVLASGCRDGFTAVGAGHVVVTTNIKEGSLSFIDVGKGRVTATWKVQKPVTGTFILPDGDTIGMYGKDMDGVELYSLQTGRAAGSWPTGKGVVNALVSGNRIFLANQTTNAVHVLGADGKEARKITVGQSPLTMTEDASHLYVLDFHDKMVTVIDKKTYAALRTWRIPASSAGAVVTSRGEMWVGGHGAGDVLNEEVHVYRTATGELAKTVQASQMPVGFAADEKCVYVLSHGTGILTKFTADGYQAVQSEPIGSNPFTVQKYGEQLYVASYDSDEVYVLDAGTMKVTGTIQVGKGPFQLTERRGTR